MNVLQRRTGRSRLNTRWEVEGIFNYFLHIFRHGGGEQEILALSRKQINNLGELRTKTKGQEFIDLVENQVTDYFGSK